MTDTLASLKSKYEKLKEKYTKSQLNYSKALAEYNKLVELKEQDMAMQLKVLEKNEQMKVEIEYLKSLQAKKSDAELETTKSKIKDFTTVNHPASTKADFLTDLGAKKQIEFLEKEWYRAANAFNLIVRKYRLVKESNEKLLVSCNKFREEFEIYQKSNKLEEKQRNIDELTKQLNAERATREEFERKVLDMANDNLKLVELAKCTSCEVNKGKLIELQKQLYSIDQINLEKMAKIGTAFENQVSELKRKVTQEEEKVKVLKLNFAENFSVQQDKMKIEIEPVPTFVEFI